MWKRMETLPDQHSNVTEVRDAIGNFLIGYIEWKSNSQDRLFSLLQSKREEFCSSHDVELILPFVIRIFEFTNGEHLKTKSQLDVVSELYTQLKALSHNINTIAMQLKTSHDQYESHAHQMAVVREIKMSWYINRVKSIFWDESSDRIQQGRSTLYQTFFFYISKQSSREDVVAAMQHLSSCIDELGLDAIEQWFRWLSWPTATPPDMCLKDFVFTVFRERMYGSQESLDHKLGIKQEVRNLKKLLWQIFHQHVNLQYDEPHYYLPQWFQPYFSPEMTNWRNAQHKLNNFSARTNISLTKEHLRTLIDAICRSVYKTAIHDNNKSSLRMGAYLKQHFFSYLASAIPEYAILEKKIPSSAQTFDDIFSVFFHHIQRADSSIAKIYTDRTFKKELTHQLVSWLLRMEVSDWSAVDNTLHATYGDEFSIDLHTQEIFKNKNISLMDFTVDMLDLDPTDIKVLLYAMICPKKHTEINTTHPLPSPDDLYTLPPWEQDLSTLLLTEKWCRYLSRAFNAAIDRHCFHSYGLHAGEVYANKTLQRDLHIDGSSYPYVFKTTDDVLAIFAWVYHGKSLGAYDAHHLSEYLGVMRCFLHVAAWQGLNTDRAASQNLTCTYEETFSTELHRQTNVQSFSRDAFPKLDLFSPHGKRIEFEEWVNDRRDTRQFNNTIVWKTAIPTVYSWRVKGLTSSVKKMMNDPQYKRLEKMWDTIANRFEVTWSGDPDDVLAVFCHTFIRLCDTSGLENLSDWWFATIRIKWSHMLKLIKDFLDPDNTAYRDHIFEKACIDTELSEDQIAVLITQLQKRYNDAVLKSTNGIINGKTWWELDELKFIRREWHEYQFMHYGAEKRWYLFHAFYNLKKVIDSDLRVNNHIHRSQVMQSMRVELKHGVRAVASWLMKLYSDSFIHTRVVEYAIKTVLMQQIVNDYYGSLAPVRHATFFDEMAERAHSYREDISQVYAHGNSLPDSLLDYQSNLLDKRLLHLMAHIARQRVDYQLDDETYWSTKVDINILNTYVHLYQYRKKSTKETSGETT